ncbi:uncharacterized protein LOC132274628 [Cornus florida]|uniref:uncharacterized protein LOC132274628 n=1 Tax=Cornus florida TaxID=4283 RepID=UPI0028969372|nr:uncharacterized protein LOC132274628 [Cornus florida]
MASTAAVNGRAKTVPNEKNNPFPNPIRSSPRRTPSSSSFSSNSSSGSLSFFNDTLFSPNTPLRSSGIPFSWEQLPGIPKKQTPENKDPSKSLLPLPPAGTSIYSKKLNPVEIPLPRKKYYSSKNSRRDPFFAALLECSKDDQDAIDHFWKGSKATKSLSDRFGFVGVYASCKRTCAVSESIIYLPRYKRQDEFIRR